MAVWSSRELETDMSLEFGFLDASFLGWEFLEWSLSGSWETKVRRAQRTTLHNIGIQFRLVLPKIIDATNPDQLEC